MKIIIIKRKKIVIVFFIYEYITFSRLYIKCVCESVTFYRSLLRQHVNTCLMRVLVKYVFYSSLILITKNE